MTGMAAGKSHPQPQAEKMNWKLEVGKLFLFVCLFFNLKACCQGLSPEMPDYVNIPNNAVSQGPSVQMPET